jgi:hypothetical protein
MKQGVDRANNASVIHVPLVVDGIKIVDLVTSIMMPQQK